ncbi:hypothetical protein RFI_21283 [Reticulomyxa filosa]|uniref:Pru domain-containing protein n=1 Tax=Reticulomyxa filosa TaxID=46433 RepID=X6MRK1_RETFI|nr:hypothetical protein RFI_21283 [Reticulomyxa filosa]|eukprot:ETO16077.1 hypothetical protein RFI_21283 [Reticulomyxa filosa]
MMNANQLRMLQQMMQAQQQADEGLVHFKAGRMEFSEASRMVTADKKPGLVKLVRVNNRSKKKKKKKKKKKENTHQTLIFADDGVTHFQWQNRISSNVDLDIMLFPNTAAFEKVSECTDGRVFVLRFGKCVHVYISFFLKIYRIINNVETTIEKCVCVFFLMLQSGVKHFFWMQEGSDEKDKEYLENVNKLCRGESLSGENSNNANSNSSTASGGALSYEQQLQQAMLHSLQVLSIINQKQQQKKFNFFCFVLLIGYFFKNFE